MEEQGAIHSPHPTPPTLRQAQSSLEIVLVASEYIISIKHEIANFRIYITISFLSALIARQEFKENY